MKSWLFSTIVIPFLLAACSNDNGFEKAIATVPPPTNCMNGQAYCNSYMYGQYYGYAAYPYSPNYSGNFCDCPVGYRPVYNGITGLGCVSAAVFQPFAYGAVYWGWGANNNQWVNVPQVSNTQGYPSNNSCYQNVAQSCFVDQYNTCSNGAICQPTSGGSKIGVCVNAATNTTTGGVGYR